MVAATILKDFFQGNIKPHEDGTLPIVKVTHTILNVEQEECEILGVIWSVDGREVVKLKGRVGVDENYILEIRNANNNTVNEDKDLNKAINEKLKKKANEI